MPTDRHHAVTVELRDFLLEKKRAADEEIRAYPTPIPRCDAQFNHLYEQRSRLAEALSRMNGALDRDCAKSDIASAVADFAASPPTDESAAEEDLRKRIAAALAGPEPV
jgi:hypothetical protein